MALVQQDVQLLSIPKPPSVNAIEVHSSQYEPSVQDDSSYTSSIRHRNRPGAVSVATNFFQFRNDHLARKLNRPQIAGIAFSGTVGIGLFITSGELIGISGSLGCVLGFIGAGAIVICVMRCLAEMVSVRPLFCALIDFPQSFVDEALGFAVGVTYWLAQCISMATLTSAAARVANNFYPNTGIGTGQISGIIIGLFFITLLSNACGVTTYGNIERIVTIIKILALLTLFVLMIVVNVGAVGYPSADRVRNYTQESFVPFFKPNGFHTTNFTTNDQSKYGVAGPSGRFLAVWTSITLAVFACMGGDIVIVAAGESRRPRKDLAAVVQFMYLIPLGCYVLGSFLVGLNVNYSEGALYRPWGLQHSKKFPSHSPFIIALEHSSLAPSVLRTVFSAIFLFSAYSAGNTALFASSRTLFALARLYGNDRIRNFLGRTNDRNTPINAILVCSLFGFLSFLGVADKTFNQPILSLSSFFTGAIGCVYAAQCVSFLRFMKGLSKLEQDGIMSRSDDAYKKKYYCAWWQPGCAYFGLLGCFLIVFFTGWPAIYIFCARNSLIEGSQLKPTNILVWDVVGAYAGPVFFFALYGGYKWVKKTKIRNLESADLRDKYDPDPRELDLPADGRIPEPQEIDAENSGHEATPQRRKGWWYWVVESWSFFWHFRD